MSGKITALEIQQGNPERVNVYIDGEFAFGLNILDAAHLRKDQELSPAEIVRLKDKDQTVQAFERAIRFLGHRPRSRTEVQRRLASQGYPETTIEKVLDRLTELEYLNDRAFARYWVENRQEFSPRGRRALAYELQQKGISRAVIDEVLTEIDSLGAAYEAAQKKARSLRGKPTRQIQERLAGFLLRRGFDYEVSRQVVAQILAEMLAETTEDQDHDEYDL